MTSKTTETGSGTSTDDRTSFVVGTITNGSSTVSSVSTADLALLAVGENFARGSQSMPNKFSQNEPPVQKSKQARPQRSAFRAQWRARAWQTYQESPRR
ncbi:hypothetical protein DYH09_13135 [bacterium CPR1]|nr:hypothetical protein [bacterium CPR1]